MMKDVKSSQHLRFLFGHNSIILYRTSFTNKNQLDMVKLRYQTLMYGCIEARRRNNIGRSCNMCMQNPWMLLSLYSIYFTYSILVYKTIITVCIKKNRYDCVFAHLGFHILCYGSWFSLYNYFFYLLRSYTFIFLNY